MVILFIGIVYVMSQRSGTGFVSFILIGAAAFTMIYWIRVLKKMTKEQKPKYAAREQETKSWVYDLIKGDEEVVFVAEVPGPEDKVTVRLIDGILYLRGSSNFRMLLENAPDVHKEAQGSMLRLDSEARSFAHGKNDIQRLGDRPSLRMLFPYWSWQAQNPCLRLLL